MSITRRDFVSVATVAGAAAVGSSLLTACKNNDGVDAFHYYINEPAYIDPYNLQENQGTAVTANLFDSLLNYDYRTQELEPAAAESWTVSDDATVFTFKLRRNASFHNGDPVTARDFVYGWERICDPNTTSEPSQISYHLGMVKGYDEIVAGQTERLAGVRALDDLTFEVTLSQPYADFIYVVSHPALAPIPSKGAAADYAVFSQAPVGNGPFMIDGKWEHNQYIRLKRFDAYYGDKPSIERVDYHIMSSVNTAYTEFLAQNLDFVQIADGLIEPTLGRYGESVDGYTAVPGKQTLLGKEASTYYLIINNDLPVLTDKNVRLAISYAINRQAICDVVFFGASVPATGIISPGLPGYQDGAWPGATYNIDKAKQALADAGYANGDGIPTFKLSYNTGGVNENIMQLVQADLRAIGISTELDGMEWAQYLDRLAARDYQVARLGWTADYPIIENYLFSLFYSVSDDNRSGYNNPAVDKGIMEARGIIDDDQRIAAFQAVDTMIGTDMPVVPLFYYCHSHVTSDRVSDFYFSPVQLPDLINTRLIDTEALSGRGA